MTVDEGKSFLWNCLANIDSSKDIDTLFCYKYASKKHAKDYQHDEIKAMLTTENKTTLKSGVPYVVVCFIHLEIYVAWHQSVGIGNGKYTVYKRDLIEFENDPSCDYMESIVGKTADSKVCIFRNESGFKKFFQKISNTTTN